MPASRHWGAQHWLRIPAVEAAQIHEVAGWLDARGGIREPAPAEVPAALQAMRSLPQAE